MGNAIYFGADLLEYVLHFVFGILDCLGELFGVESVVAVAVGCRFARGCGVGYQCSFGCVELCKTASACGCKWVVTTSVEDDDVEVVLCVCQLTYHLADAETYILYLIPSFKRCVYRHEVVDAVHLYTVTSVEEEANSLGFPEAVAKLVYGFFHFVAVDVGALNYFKTECPEFFCHEAGIVGRVFERRDVGVCAVADDEGYALLFADGI